MLKPNEVKTSNIATYAVTTSKIAKSAVTTDKIADSAVNSAKLQEECVTTNKIGDLAITNDKIADRTITQDKLVLPIVPPSPITRPISPQVESAEIKDGAIVRAKIAVNAVESDNIRDLNVTSGKLASSAVTNAKIADNAVTQSKIASNSVGASEIQANAIGTTEIANWAVTAAKLDPAIVLGGDRFVLGAEGQSGIPRSSADVLYLTDISADIPYTTFDLSPWIPANAKGVLLQIGIFNQAFTSGRAFFRVRTNSDQRDSMGVGMIPGQFSQAANGGIVPLVVGTGPRTIEYALESVGGPWVGTLTLYITVVGYIM